MTQDEMKQKAAEAAMEYVVTDSIVGDGTGTAVVTSTWGTAIGLNSYTMPFRAMRPICWASARAD